MPPDTNPSLLRRTADWLSNLALLQILEYAGRFTIVVGVILWISQCDDRARQQHLEAWQVINSAQGQLGTAGRDDALESLNRDGQELTGVTARTAYLPEVNLEGAELGTSDFQEGALEGANFQGANLYKVNLYRAYLGPSVNGEEASFASATLNYADLRGSFLQGANLQGASLTYANLDGALLEDVNLQGADLNNANLQDARLVATNLQNASLDGANFQGTDLRAADLRGARNLDEWQLDQAIGGPDTKLPRHYEQPTAWSKGTPIPRGYPGDPALPSHEYTAAVFNPTLSFSMGEGWRSNAYSPDTLALYREFEGEANVNTMYILRPQEIFDQDNPTYDVRRPSLDAVRPVPDDLVAWFQKHPYLDTENMKEKSVGSMPGKQFDWVVDSVPDNYPPTCPRPCVPLFRTTSREAASGFEGYQGRMIILNVNGETIVISVESPVNEFDEFIKETGIMIDTMRWR